MAATNPTTYNGTLSLGGTAMEDDLIAFEYEETREIRRATPVLGDTAIRKKASRFTDGRGTIRMRYNATFFDAIADAFDAGTVLEAIAVPISGAGGRSYTGDLYITSLPIRIAADEFDEVQFSVEGDEKMTREPNLVLTPAAGALTAGQVGVAYTATTFAATGGTAAYTYSLEGDNEIFPGSSLNTGTGAVTGTPIAGCEGTYRSKVRVTDANGVYRIQEYTIVIAAA